MSNELNFWFEEKIVFHFQGIFRFLCFLIFDFCFKFITSWQTDNPCFIVSLEDQDETGQILVSFIGYISNVFLVQFWQALLWFWKYVKVELSTSRTFKTKMLHSIQWKPFKNDEKYFISFHLKSSFCSQDIWIFVLTF